jgi:outer membrane lipoprotein-sorting protein
MQSWKLFCRFLAAIVLVSTCASEQQSLKPAPDDKLRLVLDRLDRTAAEFRSAEASFEWDQYQRVTNETEKQRGKVYFRRTGGGIQMAAYVTDPPPEKTILFSGGKVQLYQANTNQLDVYSTSKSNEAVESFLRLGFGGSGRDMLKSFDVTYEGEEKIDGTDTDRLELAPKSEKVRNMFNRIELWIDLTGISIQEKFISPEGDYRLNHYTNIVLNKKISDSVFKLKLSGTTRIENH